MLPSEGHDPHPLAKLLECRNGLARYSYAFHFPVRRPANAADEFFREAGFRLIRSKVASRSNRFEEKHRGNNRHPQPLCPVHKGCETADVEDGRGDDEFRTGFHLPFRELQCAIEGFPVAALSNGASDGESRSAAEIASPEVLTFLQQANGVQEPQLVQVVYWQGISMITVKDVLA